MATLAESTRLAAHAETTLFREQKQESSAVVACFHARTRVNEDGQIVGDEVTQAIDHKLTITQCCLGTHAHVQGPLGRCRGKGYGL